MPTTLPLAALVVILLGFVIVFLIASVLSLVAMRRNAQIEAEVRIASARFKININSPQQAEIVKAQSKQEEQRF